MIGSLSWDAGRDALGTRFSAHKESKVLHCLLCAAGHAAAWFSFASPAIAQTTENAVAQSSDAFGQQVGAERTGLYTSSEIRGFNPVDAGNVRIESLYYDQLDFLSLRSLQSTTIRVGLSSYGFVFPAPSGLVDYSLNMPTKDYTASLDVSVLAMNGLVGNEGGSFRVSGPVTEDVGAFVNVGQRHVSYSSGGSAWFKDAAGILAWRPASGAQIIAFGTVKRFSGIDSRPVLYTAGDFLPPQIERGVNLRQPWADSTNSSSASGLIAKVPLGGVRLEAGAFYNDITRQAQFADIMSGVGQTGLVAERSIIGVRGDSANSISGEVRLVKDLVVGRSRHRFTASVRGRQRERLFASGQRVSLGSSTILQPDVRPEVDFAPVPKAKDEVGQEFAGVAYNGNLGNVLQLDLGLSKTHYRKDVSFPGNGLNDVRTVARPWLWNATGTVRVAKNLKLFGGFVKGMEEALIAPDRAANRSESPPAIETRQKELGLQYAMGSALNLVVGAFEISKPYYNLDPSLRYRLLGTFVNKGIEVSAVSNPTPGLTVLGGVVFADPKISGEAVETGLIGARPVGQTKTHAVLNVDWRLAGGTSPWSLDLSADYMGKRSANAKNTYNTPAFAVFDVGFRYRMEIAKSKVLLRARLQNIANKFDWLVNGNGGFIYSEPRRLSMQMIADF